LSRIEDAGLNASAPPQQRWLDGWLLRTSPGKARRARCINAVATGRLTLEERLRLATAVFTEAGLPLVMRITRFSQPAELDTQLADRGWTQLDDTCVMVNLALPARQTLPASALTAPLAPAGLAWQRLGAEAYAVAVGDLRGSDKAQQQAHAQRLALSPVPYQGFVLSNAAGQVQACGQFVREAELVGLYDVFTRPEARQQGLAAFLCERLLQLAINEDAKVAYLQVERDNHAARRIYQRLGFADAYGYHYRQPPA
jgi:GNAT superfamily N-acetyltransferase